MVRVCLFFLLLALPMSAGAQKWRMDIEHQMVKTSDTTGASSVVRMNQANIYTNLGKTRLGVWAFGYEEDSYVSSVGGFYYDFTDWFELALGAGVEKYPYDKRYYERYAGSVLFFAEKTCPLMLYFERGRQAKDYWYQGDLLCTPVEGFGFGIFSQHGVGTGPRVLFRLFDKVPLEVWASPYMYDHKSKTSSRALGVRLVFEGNK